MHSAEPAFRTLIAALGTTPFRITGGLAVRAYGSTRPLADIDVEVPDATIPALARRLRLLSPGPPTPGPVRYLDDSWDLLLCTLRIHGQDIDLCGGDTCKIRTPAGWKHDPFIPGRFTLLPIFGVVVPVVPRADLIAYKTALSRPVDLEDLSFLNSQP